MKFTLFCMFFLFYNSLKINHLQAFITLFIMPPWALILSNIKKNPRKTKKKWHFRTTFSLPRSVSVSQLA